MTYEYEYLINLLFGLIQKKGKKPFIWLTRSLEVLKTPFFILNGVVTKIYSYIPNHSIKTSPTQIKYSIRLIILTMNHIMFYLIKSNKIIFVVILAEIMILFTIYSFLFILIIECE